MGTGEVVQNRDPPARAEVVHASERARITRLVVRGRTVIRKELLGAEAQRRLRHEVAMLERLRGVAGVAQLVEAPRYPGYIVLADAGGTSLHDVAKPLAVNELIALALALASAVTGMHGRGVMHRDIAPANIVLSGDRVPCLVGFGLAMSLAEIRPQFMPHSEIVGTLAYLAPEQTGRIGRPVDQRADLYALGATLYELATGAPPFGAGDPLRLTHDHLARVPVPPAEVNRTVPGPLSAIVMHLLEKEPDDRYQTADGVIYDLERLRDADGRAASALRVGERDVPLRLLPPSRLVGRDDEVAALQEAFANALAGRCRGVLVRGAPGVGKTALIDELRSVVTGRHGWFVAGKFDQYRRDLEFDAGYQAFRALGRLLLAEPEDELAAVRERILAAVGPNAGLLSAAAPEFAALLAVAPEPGDALTAQVRARRTAAQVLRAVASRQRPLVMFLDDLQWAGRAPLGFVDLVLSEEPVDGLLLVGAYREDDVDAAHPLAAPLSRWRNQAGVRQLRLESLPLTSLEAMVTEMLHADPATAAGLAEAISPHTSGNPYETVELLNALRRDGLLRATAAGWRWDEVVVRAHLGRSDVAGLLAARGEALPAASRRIVEAMACLGGRAELRLLQTATAEPAGVVEQALAPALDDGLLMAEPGVHPAVRFRHNRTREASLRGLDPQRRRALQLAMARRLAEVPELFAVAAEQYLPVIDAVDDASERRRVVGLLRRAADQAALLGDHALVNALLTAALRLIDPDETTMLVEVRTARHAALVSMGWLDEADEEYRTIEQLGPTVVERTDARATQVLGLSHRKRFVEAVALGLDSLRELGVTVPAADRLPAELEAGFEYLYGLLDRTDGGDDLSAPDITDPTQLAASRLINATLPTAYFAGDVATHGWLTLEALRIWLEHGPGRTLVGPASVAALTAMERGDYAAAYRLVRRIVALGAARGYEPGTSQARLMLALSSCWFEPIENSFAAAQQAREGVLADGDLVYAGYCYYPIVYYLLDHAPSLDSVVAEVEAGLAFVRRTGIEQTAQLLDPCRWLADVLRGESSVAADDAVPVEGYAGNPKAIPHVLLAHLARATVAAIFGEPDDLARHSAAAMSLLRTELGLYSTATARLLRGLALAGQARATEGDERGGVLGELEEVTGWLAARAADAPDNFRHLVRLLDAERAWAVGDFRAAVVAFDGARREVAGRQRPWHRALITERTARFYLAHGVDEAGLELLAQARGEYLAWGATAKVAQLDWAYPTLRPGADTTAGPRAGQPADASPGPSAVSTGTIDLLGILSASQALSSETSIERLHARVVEVVSAMTGATGVRLALWNEDRHDWLLRGPDSTVAIVPISGSGHDSAIPLSVLRYVERTREPLVVNDAAHDDRFARDPYFTDIDCCSLLAFPVLSRGALRAVLVVDNRLIRGAFTSERLDAVKLIAGQLAISLDNAQLYAEVRRIADEHRRIADQQAALRRVATLVARGESPAAVFNAVTAEMERLLDADGVALIRYEPGEEAAIVAHRGANAELLPPGSRLADQGQSVTTVVPRSERPAGIEYSRGRHDDTTRLARALGVQAAVGAPIVVDGRLWGVAGAYWTGEESPPGDSEERIAQFAQLLESAIANADSRDQLIASRARLLTEADAARRRVVRDLHDGAQQRLVHTVITLGLAQRAMRERDQEAESLVAEAVEYAQQANEELRELAHGLLPADLTRAGLGGAVDSIVERLDLPVTVDVAPGRLPAEIEANAYFIVAEALTNIVKHARAGSAAVTAAVTDGMLHLEVRDDGVGGADPGSHGLVGIDDRVTALGGRFTVRSPRGGGTVLTAALPIPEAPAGIS